MPKTDRPDIDADLVRKLAELLDETGMTEIEYGTTDWHLRVSKGGGAPAVVAAPVAVPAPAVAVEGAPAESHPGTLKSPMVGVVYTLPEPDAPPMIKVGDPVTEGQTVLLIEAMKVFNPIKAPRAGTVTRIFVSNGDPVEFGEPLLVIE